MQPVVQPGTAIDGKKLSGRILNGVYEPLRAQSALSVVQEKYGKITMSLRILANGASDRRVAAVTSQGKRISSRWTLYEPCSLRCHSEERGDEESAVA
ncbi:MAG: hypothetical protein ACP5E2_13880, partial [Terracidiphilus sp.]